VTNTEKIKYIQLFFFVAKRCFAHPDVPSYGSSACSFGKVGAMPWGLRPPLDIHLGFTFFF